jgi:hypothetical protein
MSATTTTTTTTTPPQPHKTTLILITPCNKDHTRAAFHAELAAMEQTHQKATASMQRAMASLTTPNTLQLKQTIQQRALDQHALYCHNVSALKQIYRQSQSHVIHVPPPPPAVAAAPPATKDTCAMGGYYLFKTLEREYGSNENNRATKVNDVTMSLLHKHYPTVKEHRWQNNTTSTLRVLIPGIGLLGLAHCLLVWFQSSSCATTNHHHLMIDGCDLSLSSLLLGTGMLSMLHTAPTTTIDSPLTIYPEASLTSIIDTPNRPTVLYNTTSSSAASPPPTSTTSLTTSSIVRVFHQDFHAMATSPSNLTEHLIVITQFFLDAVPNIIQTMEQIIRRLASAGGGLWINVGPLKYYGHHAHGPTLTWQEILLYLNSCTNVEILESTRVDNVSYFGDQGQSSTVNPETYTCCCFVVFVGGLKSATKKKEKL